MLVLSTVGVASGSHAKPSTGFKFSCRDKLVCVAKVNDRSVDNDLLRLAAIFNDFSLHWGLKVNCIRVILGYHREDSVILKYLELRRSPMQPLLCIVSSSCRQAVIHITRA